MYGDHKATVAHGPRQASPMIRRLSSARATDELLVSLVRLRHQDTPVVTSLRGPINVQLYHVTGCRGDPYGSIHCGFYEDQST
jgi:hypothetical protein